MKSRFESARKWLILGTLFIGIGAVGGTACMLAAPDGSLLGLHRTGLRSVCCQKGRYRCVGGGEPAAAISGAGDALL